LLCVLWIVGLFAQLPLIPFIETDYILSETNDTLGKGVLVKEENGLNIKIEVPSYFPEKEQCFDTWFTSTKGQHILSVSNFSIKAFRSDNSEIIKGSSYLFWDSDGKDETFSIDDYEIAKSDTFDKSKYAFFRSEFNVDKESDFSLLIKATYSLDDIQGSVERKMSITKKHRLTWNKLRAH
jgi:hypothetical protein